VQTGTAPAEYGRTTSTAITVSTQSGSNQIHGSAYEFLRNDLFDATPYFGHTKDSLKRNQFGGTLGGPIVRNKLFLFGNYEGFQQRAGGPPVVGLVPTSDQRNGIFDHTIVDPNTCTDFSDKTTCTPFANNTIPADRISPISLALLNYWPEPNATGDPTRNFIFQPHSSPTRRHYGLIRSDYNPHPSDSFFVRFLRNDESVSTPPQFLNGVKGTSFGLTAWTAGGHYTHIFSPQLINDFGFGGSTIAWSTLSLLANQEDIATKVGIENTAGINDPRFSGTPAISIPGLLSLGDQSPLARYGHLYQAMDAITWQLGKHSLKFGGDWRRNYVNEYYTGQNDSNSFSNKYTLDSFADFLLGIPSSVNKTARAKAYGGSVDAFSAFIQDDWRIAPRLTLNVGVRYDIETALSSPTHDFLRWNQQTGEMILSDKIAGKGEIADFYANVRPDIKVRFVSEAAPYDVNRLNLAPRLGFAYQALSKVVIRGGFGMFYGSPSVSWLESANDFAPNSLRPNWTGNSTRPVFVLPNGSAIPSGYNPEGSGGLEATVAYPAPLTIFPIYSRYLPYPTNLQWSLGIQTQVTPTLVIETQYLGSHAYHNNGYTNTNVVATPDPAPIQPRLPFPSFARIQGVVFGEDAWFEGVSVKAEKRVGKGLSFLASYTWSKSLDTGSTIEAKGLWTDPLNQRRTAKGLSYFDVPQHLVVSAQYDLPFGRGHVLAGAAGPVLNNIIGGWNVRGIGNFQSGFPFDPSMSLARTNICATACTVRPDVVHDPNLPGDERIKNGLSSTPGIGYWDASAFVLPSLSAPRIGNAGRGLLRGPGINNFDLGVFKRFAITERVGVEFGYEAFNAFNHPQFLAPSTNLENLATFGKLTGTNPPRISQFVLKVSF
jgi:outer membrane receptor protein involved in Fe transport